jgi:hypothetical protein
MDRIERICMVIIGAEAKDRTCRRNAMSAMVSCGWLHHVLEGLETESIIEGPKVIGIKRS